MSARDCRRGVAMLIIFVAIVPLATASAQSAPDLTLGLDGRGSIPAPVTIRPPIVGAYGALIAAAMLGVLYIHRGRAFIVYWIGSWLCVAASLMLRAQGYQDLRLGGVMLGLGQLLGVWSAGLTLLAVKAFPGGRLLLNVPLMVAAVTAVWFLVVPFQLPLSVVLATGSAAAAMLFGWTAALWFLRLAQRTPRYLGAWVLGAGTLVMCATNAAALGVGLGVLSDVSALSRLVALNIIINMFVVLGMHVLVFEDMTHELRRANRDLAQANQEIKSLSTTDALTGCHNRRFFEQIERREIQRHRRYNSPLSIVFADVNHFKQVNDTLGHDTGDRVLRTIGAFLRKQVRESDYVIRWGGDEFLLLLTCNDIEAEGKAHELKVAFERERRALSLPDGLGLSIGVASASVDAESLAEAIRLADTRMYRDKLGT
jgi:diguanylate cyclase (GGDEF)-like protein